MELAALNGEDHYSAAGQVLYLEDNAGRFSEIALGVNVDGAGCVGSRPAYCLFAGVTHTPGDRLERVDPAALDALAAALQRLIAALEETAAP